ncbi:lumenal Hsp70 protein [Lambiella insularis]|nr:lumenal Hsp70 protein [Lambiella insularis]
MPSHGHRRRIKLLLFLSVFSLLFSAASAASAVLGIDLGTEYIKAALVKPGIPLEIVLTKDSKRKEAAAIAFKPLKSKAHTSDSDAFPERLYGGDAVALSARFPGDVYSNLKPLLGATVKRNEAAAHFGSWRPDLKIAEDKERGTVGFRSESFTDKEELFTVEELLAMQLQNVRNNAEVFAGKGSTIRDVVMSIPVFYTAEEKRAVEAAVDLAGLRLLSMMSDGLSIGLNYATSRTFPVPKDGIKPEYHLVYDMGAGSTTATVLKFQGKNVKDVGKFNKTVQDVQVMGVGWDRTLGGDAFNVLILEEMISKFVDIPHLKTLGVTATHIKKDGRTLAKLWKEAERMRQVLSANSDTSASFEGLFYEDVNFKYKLSRSEFESLAARYMERVRYPIARAVASAKLELSEIESIILHGGAVRTPFVQKELEAIAGNPDKVRTNVNSDEAACFGAAFNAAGISTSFRVKEIRTSDVAAHAAVISWVSEGKEKQQKLFQPTSQVGAEKQVPFKITQDFSFSLYQQVSEGVESSRDIPVSRIETQNLTASVKELTEKYGCSVADITTSFSIRLSAFDGLPEVTRGSVSCEVVDLKKGDFVGNVKGLFGFGSKKGDQEPIDGEAGASKSEADFSSSALSATKSISESKVPKTTDIKGADKAKDKKETATIYIRYTMNVTGLPQISSAELQRMKDRMASFDASDRSRKLREEALNTLEGYTYKARDLIEDEGFIAASTDKQRSEIEDKFKAASEWLYGDGADANREALKARLKELRDLVDPISRRKEEASKRPGEVKMLQETLEQTKGLIEMVKKESEKAAEAAAAMAASSSSSKVSPQTTSELPSVSEDAFAGLDGDPSTPAPTASSTKAPEVPMYTVEDFADLSQTHESVKIWLDNKLTEQGKLSPSDDPVILSSEIAAKSKELNKVVMNVLSRKMQIPPIVKSSSKSKTSKTKTHKQSKSSASIPSVSSTSSSSVEASSATATATGAIHADMPVEPVAPDVQDGSRPEDDTVVKDEL